jgi:Ran GTPase-activating protein (RanGAP) involved in mRNA processing and transport
MLMAFGSGAAAAVDPMDRPAVHSRCAAHAPLPPLFAPSAGDTAVAHLASLLAGDCSIEQLCLESCLVSARAGPALAAMLRVNTRLTLLDLCANSLHGEGLVCIAEALYHNRALRTLLVADNHIDAAAAAVLQQLLERNATLTSLDLSSNELRSAGALAIGLALRVNSTLRVLSIRDNSLGDADAVEADDDAAAAARLGALETLLSALAHNAALEELDLSCNSLGAHWVACCDFRSLLGAREDVRANTESCMAKLGAALAVNSTLRRLVLRRNNLADSSMCELAAGLAVNRSMLDIDVEANEVRVEGLRVLFGALRQNSVLQSLNIRQNLLTAADLASLAVEQLRSGLRILVD